MKQGNYEHRIVTHLDKPGSKHFTEMLKHYKTRQSILAREALEFFYQHRYLVELSMERKQKVVQLDLFSKAQN